MSDIDVNAIIGIKKDIINMISESKEGHIPSAFSILDIIYVLYKKILKFDSKNPDWSERDYFILSKGHGCAALYSVLANEGFFSGEELKNYCRHMMPNIKRSGTCNAKIP